MEILLTVGFFGIAFILLSLGAIFTKKEIRAGSCGSGLLVKGEQITCGACPSKEAEVCPSGDKEGYATLAQMGNPGRKKVYRDNMFHPN